MSLLPRHLRPACDWWVPISRVRGPAGGAAGWLTPCTACSHTSHPRQAATWLWLHRQAQRQLVGAGCLRGQLRAPGSP